MSANMYDAWDCGDRPAIRAKLQQRDDIIRMAREAGWKDLREFDSEMHDDIFMGKTADLERFAALVAAAEREACAKVCEDIATETYGMTKLREYGECAAAIRARGQE